MPLKLLALLALICWSPGCSIADGKLPKRFPAKKKARPLTHYYLFRDLHEFVRELKVYKQRPAK